MKSKNEKQEFPRTGRIGRYVKIVESNTTKDSFLKIIAKSDEYGKYKPEKKALWWKKTVETMENEVGREKAIEIMKTCGSKCCGQGNRKTAKRLMNESSSIPEFLDKLSKYEVKEGELEYKLIDAHTIIGKHNRCFCGQVKKLKEHFNSNTYCQCSVEFNKQFFEAAFEKPVEVELKQSILTGGEFCEFEIRI